MQFWAGLDSTVWEGGGYRVFTNDGKTVVVCGTNHGIRTPGDNMFTQLDSLLENFQPQLILVESYTPIDPNKEEAARSGDAAYCNFWGAAHRVPVYCWSDDWEEIFAQLKEKFSAEQAVLMLMSLYDSEYYANWGSFVNYEEFYALRASMMDYHGLIASPLQRNPSYYYNLCKTHYGETFQSAYPPSNFEAQMQRIRRHPLFNEGFSNIQTQRDLALLRAISEALTAYDTIFVQVGFVHLKSIASVLPRVMDESPRHVDESHGDEGMILLDTYRAICETDSLLISEVGLRDGTTLRFVSAATEGTLLGDTSLTGVLDEWRAAYEAFEPSLVAVQGNMPLHATEKQSLHCSGVGSLYRYIGLQRGNQIRNWLPVWEEIYLRLADTYDEKELYINAFIFQYLTFQDIINMYNFSSGTEAFDWIYRSLWSTGFPIQPKSISEMDYFFQLVNSKADRPATAGSTFEDFIVTLECMANRNMLEDIRLIAINYLFAMCYANKGKHKRILVQVDYPFFKMIDEVIGNCNIAPFGNGK